MPEIPLWAYLLSLALAALPGSYAVWRARRKTDAEAVKAEADAAHTLTLTAMAMVEKYKTRIDCLEREIEEHKERQDRLAERQRDLEKRLDVLERELEECQRGCALLINQVMELGEDPAWMPGDIPKPSR